MDHFLAILIGLLVALGIVTLVGHGLWVLLAGLFGSTTGSGQAGTKNCPQCGARLLADKCPVCNWPGSMVPRDHTTLVLHAMRDQIDRFARMGLIEPEAHRRLVLALDTERERRESAQTAALVAQIVVVEPEVAAKAPAASPLLAVPPMVAQLATPPVAAAQSATVTPALPVHALDMDYPVVAAQPQAAAAFGRPLPDGRGSHDSGGQTQVAAGAPRPRRAPFSSLLAAFMEERNIRWGELVGGLLIVCCSIALVVSFWAQIAERPLLKFLLFNGVTASLFGLGLYSGHRWKLETTSRAVLTIAMLLVPLNFLAITAFSSDGPANLPLTIAGEAASVLLFAALCYWGGRAVVPDGSGLLAIGVIWPSIVQVLVRRWIDPAAEVSRLLTIGAMPLVGYAAVNGRGLWRKRRTAPNDEATFRETLALLGISTFAALMPLGLMLFKTGHVEATLHQLAVLVTAAGMPALAVGLFLWRRMTDKQLAGLRTTALAVAVAGAATLVAGVALPWPIPMALLPAAVVAAATFVGIALVMRMPEAQLPGVACVALAFLTAWHLAAGRLVWQAQPAAEALAVFISGSSGQALLILATALFAASAGMTRLARRIADGRMLAIGAAAIAAAGLGIVGWFGFGVPGDPLYVTWIFVFFGAAICVAAAARKSVEGLWTGAALVLGASIQGVVYLAAYNWLLAMPWATAIALDASLMAVTALACRRLAATRGMQMIVDAAAQAAFVASLAAAVLIGAASIGGFEAASAGPLAVHWAWLAAIWLGIAMLENQSPLFNASQVAMTAAVWFGVGVWLEEQTWFAVSSLPWLDPWTLQAEGVGIVAFCSIWILLRWIARRCIVAPVPTSHGTTAAISLPSRITTLVASNRLAADRAILRAVLVVFVALGLYAAWPGVAQELTPRVTNAVIAFSPAQHEILRIPHEHAAGWGSWLLMGAIAAALVVEMLTRRSTANWSGVLLTLAVACPLAGSRWSLELAAASATRWFAAMFMIAGTAFVLIISRWADRQRFLGRIGNSIPNNDQVPPNAPALIEPIQSLLLLLGGGPALVLAGYAVAMAAAQAPLTSPGANSLFGRMGQASSYAGPIALTAAVLIASGLRRRADGLILCGGLVVNLAATVAYLLAHANPVLNFDTARWIELAQLNAIVSASFALVWTSAIVWRSRRQAAPAPADSIWPLVAEVRIAMACNAAVLGAAWLTLVTDPSQTQSFLKVADAWGWLAAALMAAALFAAGRVVAGLRGVPHWAGWLVAVATLAAWTACRWDTGNWLGYHVLLAAHLTIAGLIAAVGWIGEGRFARRDWTTNLALVGVAFGVMLGLRTLDGDPMRPWWAIGALASQALLVVWLASWSLRRGLLHVAALFINAAASNWWIHHVRIVGAAFSWLELIEINIVALALPVAGWLALELLRFRPRLIAPTTNPSSAAAAIPVHRFAARTSLTALAAVVGIRLALTAMQVTALAPVGALEWIALAAVGLATITNLWDAGAHSSVVALYYYGLIVAGVVLDSLHLEPKWLWWGGDLALAAYALATSALWWRRDDLRSIADGLRIPRPAAPLAELDWLLPLNCTIVALVAALSFGFVLTFDDYALRLAAAKAVLFQTVTIGLLAHGARRWQLQHFSLSLGALGAIAVGWSFLDPASSELLLYRLVAVAAALALTAVAYSLGLAKLLAAESDWLRAAKRIAPLVVAIDAAAILLVLGVEVTRVVAHGQIVLAPAAIAVTGVVLLGLCVACLAAALLPGRDPLGLSERGRTAYVYAAEALLALLFVHIRLTKPEWFHGYLEQYWPLVVQGIAFVGVGVGEWFRRRRIAVLGEPLANTGAFLPLLPVIGFWVLPARVDYSVLLLVVGLLYAAISLSRRSFAFGLLALAAANGSLWYFLARQDGYRFLEHPQLWLIPPALCVLVAAHLNRRQLTPDQTTAIRYGASIVLYVSSTADIFLQGVAHAPWLPLVLGGISLAGVFVGILLRVRAFLILGTSFLLVALSTIIWYAAVDLQQTWLWSATGIVTGVLILITFAIFEKQRQAVLGMLERLKQWQP